jgi:hypothetical protein
MKKYNIFAKTWFDRANGNSYFSSRVFDLEGNLLKVLPLQYGYGSHYLYESLAAMGEDTKKLCPSDVVAIHDNQEGCLKRDVKSWGEV